MLTGIRGNWDFYQRHVAKHQELLMVIKAQFGYGGAIHNLKSLVLRGEQKFVDRFNANYQTLTNAIKQFSIESQQSTEVARNLNQQAVILQDMVGQFKL